MQKNSKIYFLVFVIILITGISMRASIFFKNPALWIDEALTANKLIHSPIKSLVMPDAAAQEMTMHAYPFGFLALSQFVIILFGLTEMTLRLIPFLSGIMALFIFRRIAQHLFNPPWDLWSFAMFAICNPLILHSVELKPYSSDVLICVCLILTAIKVMNQKNRPPAAHYIVIGIFSLITSFPAVFLIFSFLIIWIFLLLFRRNFKAFIYWSSILFILVAFQGLYFFISLRHFFSDSALTGWWTLDYLPIASGFVECAIMLWRSFADIFCTWGIPPVIGILFLINGMISIVINDFKYAVICLAPIMATLLASALHCYPFAPRTVLFLTPIFIILIMQGCQWTYFSKWPVFRKIMNYTCIAFLLITCFTMSLQKVKDFSFGEDIRPLVQYLYAHRKNTDGLYLNSFAHPIYWFYLYYYSYPPIDYTGLFSDQPNITANGLSTIQLMLFPNEHICKIAHDGNSFLTSKRPDQFIRHGRNWFLMTHIPPEGQEFILNYLDAIGTRIMTKQSDRNAVLYLYDINYAGLTPGE